MHWTWGIVIGLVLGTLSAITKMYKRFDQQETEIERLREALKQIAEFDLYGDYSNAYEIQPIAIAALKQKDSE